ncbi:ABC transporter ATP-binding protein [Flexivirga alba]|uniref:ABC transporter ATP-binding protein n=1 Tax=Flexivirga alba TaxID=702742 RepID=A0ABW2ADJ5_9MICO
MNVIETSGLGRRYGHSWALRDCTIAVPEGHLVALVGPNGAGKSTFLHLVVGLASPSEGEVRVLSGEPAGSPASRDGIAFVAQDMPLYRRYSVADMLHLTRNLNQSLDMPYAIQRLADLGINPKQRTGSLSGGQHAQLALTLAIARHPRLLVLDEPTASLDPLARHDFMATVMTAMAEDGVSVVLSSHVLAELERVADFLILLTHGQIRLTGTVDSLLADHRFVTCPADADLSDSEIIESRTSGPRMHCVAKVSAAHGLPPGCETRPVGIEELSMAYLRESTHPQPSSLLGVAR